MFFDKYTLTLGGLPKPKFSSVAMRNPWKSMESGLYNNGVVTVFDEHYDDSFLASWEWLVGAHILLVACTCWGDFIYVCLDDGEFYIVLADQYQKFPMGNSFSSVFDMNIANDRFIKEILRPDLFEKYKRDVGLLEYGEMYTYSRQKKAPVKRSVSLFLDVAGQTGRQLKNGN